MDCCFAVVLMIVAAVVFIVLLVGLVLRQRAAKIDAIIYEEPEQRCPNCGRMNAASTRVCPHCEFRFVK
jgi:hypothetical protein